MGFVQGVKMNSRGTGFEQLLTLPRCELDAEFRRCRIVIPKLFQGPLQLLRDGCSTNRGESLQLSRAQNGEDPRADGHCDSQADQIIPESKEVRIVEE